MYGLVKKRIKKRKEKKKKREKTILLSIEQLKNAGHVGHGPGIGRLGVIMPATGGNRRSSGAFFLPHEAPTVVSGGPQVPRGGVVGPGKVGGRGFDPRGALAAFGAFWCTMCAHGRRGDLGSS